MIDGSEDTASDRLSGDLGKEALNGVEPRAGSRREVEGPARILCEPGDHLGMLLGRVIVHDGVDHLAGRDGVLPTRHPRQAETVRSAGHPAAVSTRRFRRSLRCDCSRQSKVIAALSAATLCTPGERAPALFLLHETGVHRQCPRRYTIGRKGFECERRGAASRHLIDDRVTDLCRDRGIPTQGQCRRRSINGAVQG